MTQPWQTVPLGNILNVRREKPDSDDISQGRIRTIAKIGFSDGQIEARSQIGSKTNMVLVQPGDLVISGINAAKGAVAYYDTSEPDPIAATIHYSAYSVASDRADAKYLWWYLRSRTFRELLIASMPGGIKTEVRPSRLLAMPVGLPGLSEQRRIRAKIEEVAHKTGEVSRLRTLATEAASVLHAAIASETLGTLPADGILGDVLLEKPRNGWSPRCNNAEGGTPVLSLSAVTGFNYSPRAFKRTAEPIINDAHYWLRSGDLLVSRSNTATLVGHAAIYDGTPAPCIYPDLMIRLRPNPNLADVRFVWAWLQTSLVRDHLSRNAKGTSPTMKKISQQTLRSTPFPVTLPIAKQRALTERLNELRPAVDELRSRLEQLQSETDSLLPAVLSRAFKGDL